MIVQVNSEKRAQAALQRIAMLNAEQQTLYQRMAYRSKGFSCYERDRLQEIVRELAFAQDERNRARCGAPPAPPDYDPFRQPPIIQENFDTEEKGNRKTNEDEVMEMRRLYNEEGMTATAIWHEFGHLKESTVRDILKNRTWYDPNYVPRLTRQPKIYHVKDMVRQRTQWKTSNS